MARKIVAVLIGIAVWFVFYVILLLTFSDIYLFIVAAIVVGLTSASIAKEHKFIIAIVAILLAYIPTAIWGFSNSPALEGSGLLSIILSLIIGSVIFANMAVLGVFLSKMIFKKTA